MDTECLNIIVSIMLGLIQIILTIVIFKLSKRISLKAKLDNRNQIKPKLDEIINNIYVKKNRKHSVVLVDADVYEKYYPSNENPFGRYSHFKAEIKNTRFDGVEFFWGEIKAYYNQDKDIYYFKNQENTQEVEVNIIAVIPYDWILDVELHGDEYNGALIYCKFKNKSFWKLKHTIKVNQIHRNKFKRKRYWRLERKYDPFVKCKYYIENKWFNSSEMHFDSQYLEIEISKK